jgi:hypothetical protein
MLNRKIFSFIKEHLFFILVLGLGIFLRLYKSYHNLDYAHDQDLEVWVIRDIINGKHLRLIGQETSTQGIFIGALYYYLLIPFYIVAKMDPVGGIALATILGIFGIWSFYYVFKNIFNKNTAILASLIYAVSFGIVINDRSIVPTSPVVTWTVWFFYALNLILNGKQLKGFILSAILVALIWHLNVALILLTPLLVISFFLSQKKLNIKYFISSIIVCFVLLSPFFLFELRHNFQQVRSVAMSFSTDQGSHLSTFSQTQRVIHIMSDNASGLIAKFAEESYLPVTLIIVLTFGYLWYKKIINWRLALLMFLWQVSYVAFFSLYSKPVSEYYLNGMNVIWIAVMAVGVAKMFERKDLKLIAMVIPSIFVYVNVSRLTSYTPPENGYIYKRQMISEIKNDAIKHGFPCVSISYITNPGYDRGYRYLFLMEEIKLKPISLDVPVYSIVFPQKSIFKTDKSFGAIGLIYPNYGQYDIKKIKTSCQGSDFNTEDSLIGFTN